MGKEKYDRLDYPEDDDQKHLTNRRSSCSYFNATPLEKWLSLVLTLAVFAILGLAIYIGIDRAQSSKTVSSTRPCSTQDCVAFAGEVAASLNTSVDPCENFYEYACGGYVSSHLKPDDVGRLSSFSALETTNKARLRTLLSEGTASDRTAVEKARQIYKTCLDTATTAEIGNAPLLSFITTLGGLPVAKPTTYSQTSWNLNSVLKTTQLRAPRSGLFSLSVEKDQKDATRNLLHVYQTSLGMGSKTYYGASSPTNDRYQLAYLQLMTSVFTELGAGSVGATAAANEILALEKELAATMASLTELRHPSATYNVWTIGDLQQAIPEVLWLELVKHVLPSQSAQLITQNTLVIVQWESYFRGLSAIVKKYLAQPRILANYMTWISIRHTLSYLEGPLKSASDVYSRKTAGTSAPSQSKFCTSMADSLMGSATSRLFVDKYFSPATRKAASVLIADVRQAFLDNLPTVQWMDEVTQAAAAEKAKAVRQQVGYADFIEDNAALNKRYEDLHVNATCSFCNYLAGHLHSSRRNFKKLFSPVELEFSMTAPTVNAYYSGVENVIVFPAGILQPTFYYATGPAAMNYGGIGAVVGHELTHGFDDKGRHFDKNGNLRTWWTTLSAANFDERATCIANQYSNYTILGQHVNGRQTLGENIADHGGLKLAYNAYRKHVKAFGDHALPGVKLTTDQLFYVSFARTWCSISGNNDVLSRLRTDVHAPTSFRVIGTVSDDENFAKAFKCAKGTPMNPENQCPLW